MHYMRDRQLPPTLIFIEIHCTFFQLSIIFTPVNVCVSLVMVMYGKTTSQLFYSNPSEIRGLRSTKCSSETLQNLLYFMYKKTHVVFFFFHFVQLYIFTL